MICDVRIIFCLIYNTFPYCTFHSNVRWYGGPLPIAAAEGNRVK